MQFEESVLLIYRIKRKLAGDFKVVRGIRVFEESVFEEYVLHCILYL